MEPSDYLIAVLVFGAVGSAILTFAFILAVSAFIGCPECHKRSLRSSSYCGHCGERFEAMHRPGPVQTHDKQPAAGLESLSEDSELQDLFESICRLAPEKRAQLSKMMRKYSAIQTDHKKIA